MEYPEILNLSEILPKPHNPSPHYQLVGVIENTGSTPESGHCIAYRRLPSESTDQWIKCNDSIVTDVKIGEVLNRRPMVLLYEQLEPSQK